MEKIPPFIFKTKEELEAMSFGERAIYFENLLTDLCSRQGKLDETAREQLTLIGRRKISAP
jgi:hypothetical protein